MNKFSVIATDTTTGQTVICFVLGESGINAFAAAAAMNDDLEMVVALPGWVEEGVHLQFPGDGPVGATTVSEQIAVFGEAPCLLDEQLVAEVLRAYSLRVCNSDGASFDTMAAGLVDELDKSRLLEQVYENVEEGTGRPACQQALFALVHLALVEKGVIEF